MYYDEQIEHFNGSDLINEALQIAFTPTRMNYAIDKLREPVEDKSLLHRFILLSLNANFRDADATVNFENGAIHIFDKEDQWQQQELNTRQLLAKTPKVRSYRLSAIESLPRGIKPEIPQYATDTSIATPITIIKLLAFIKLINAGAPSIKDVHLPIEQNQYQVIQYKDHHSQTMTIPFNKFEETIGNGKLLEKGNIDMWKDLHDLAFLWSSVFIPIKEGIGTFYPTTENLSYQTGNRIEIPFKHRKVGQKLTPQEILNFAKPGKYLR